MRDLAPLFAPTSIAVVGASTKPGKLGAAMARQLSLFDGTVSLVNSRSPDPRNRVYASVADVASQVGQVPDLVISCIPADATLAALAEAADAGARAAVVCAGGFAEVDEVGRYRQDQLSELAARENIRILGPNTSGFVVPALSLFASFVRGAERIGAGTAVVVAASGGMGHALAFALSAEGVGVDLAVGLGNCADVTAADVIAYAARRPGVRCVALHVESVSDGQALTEAVRSASETVPVVALVVGQSDVSDFARSHTGALATSWRVTQAALQQAGAVVVEDERALVDAVCALSAVRLPAGSTGRTGLVTAQAGPGLLLADRLTVSGAELPRLSAESRRRLGELLPPMTYQENPVDTGRPDDSFAGVLRAVAADPAIDVLAIYGLLEPDAFDLAACVAEVATAIPVVTVVAGADDDVADARSRLLQAGAASLATPSAAVHALAALRQDAQIRSRRRRTPEPAAAPAPPLVLPDRLNEGTLKELLRRSGVQTPRGVECADREQARAAIRHLTAPVAVKMLEPVVAHKSDLGAVHLGIRSASEMDRAVDALLAIGATAFLVEEMAEPGTEILLGAHRDPVFGPVVVLGLGGVAAELIGDIAIRTVPLTSALISDMLDELTLGPLLRGYRGAPPVDEAGLRRAARVVERVVLDNPHVLSFEINPLRVLGDGHVVALDATLSRKPESAVPPRRPSEPDNADAPEGNISNF